MDGGDCRVRRIGWRNGVTVFSILVCVKGMCHGGFFLDRVPGTGFSSVAQEKSHFASRSKDNV
jgi:hypothetical protein